MEIKQVSLKARRISLSSFFFFYGFSFAAWASRIPNIQHKLGLTETTLGAVLLAMPVGSFLTLPFSGYYVSKIGSKKVVIFSSIAYAFMLICIGFSENILQLSISLFLFGSSGNMMNIAINTQAIALEKLYQKTIISSFHGMWSIAGLAAASLGTFLIGRNFPVHSHLLIVGLFSFLSFIICASFLLIDDGNVYKKRAFFVKPGKALIGLGMIAFCSMMCQGAIFDWSGVYFEKVIHAERAYIGIGFTAFMISMTITRFIADWLTLKMGFKAIIKWCGLSVMIGLSLAVFFPYLLPGIFGMLLVGIGVSPVVPLVFSAAGKSKEMSSGVAIAAVSSVGFIGLLIGPPMIGFIAGATSLKISFLILAIVGIAVTFIVSLVKL